MRPEALNLFKNLFHGQPRPYRVSVVTNATPDGFEVAEKDVSPGQREIVSRDLGLSWPVGVYSLSHVALPFRLDDPLYGLDPDPRESYGIRLGLVRARGERGVMTISADDIMRLGSNPFFPYLEERTREWLTGAVERR